MKCLILLMVFLLVTAGDAFTQQDLAIFNRERNDLNKRGFLVLGSWSAASIITGIAGQAGTEGQTRYFHQMNVLWGSVNLLVALPSFIIARKGHSDDALAGTVRSQSAVEKTFLLNAGLDLAYMAGGAWCLEKGNTSSKPAKYKGYGKSILLQGAALLLFDAFMFGSHNRHGAKLFRVLEGMKAAPNGLGLSFRL